MVNETELAYAEVDAILELLEDEYVNRIPAQVREFFKKRTKNISSISEVI
ncbi:MAG: hypothetical protein V8R82_10295 [Clostridia bacterium]